MQNIEDGHHPPPGDLIVGWGCFKLTQAVELKNRKEFFISCVSVLSQEGHSRLGKLLPSSTFGLMALKLNLQSRFLLFQLGGGGVYNGQVLLLITC